MSEQQNVDTERLTNVVKDALREITDSAESLRRAIVEVQRDATSALATMATGGMPTGFHGPVHLNDVGNVVLAQQKLQDALAAARKFRYIGLLTDDEIESAYRAGAGS